MKWRRGIRFQRGHNLAFSSSSAIQSDRIQATQEKDIAKSPAALGSDRQRDRIPLVATAFLLLAALLFRSCLWAQGGGIPAPSFSPDSIVSSANGSSDSLTP